MTEMPARILLLGLGAQGKAALHDLIVGDATTRVTVADADPSLFDYVRRYPEARVTARRLDAADAAGVASLMREADVVIEALPGPFALAMGRLAAECGVSLASSMYYRDPQERDATRVAEAERMIAEVDRAAKARGATILTEFGLDPGLDLVMGVRALAEVDEVLEFHAYGAGLPAVGARDNPLRYKFSWSPIGVMRSYNRPARIITGGAVQEIAPDALFEPHRYHVLDVPAIGEPLECYPNGDAVHYADLFGVATSVREMARYTGRFRGHCALWDAIVKCGFLDAAPVQAGGVMVAPIEMMAALLASQPRFQYANDEADLTFVRVDVRGIRDGARVRIVYDLIDTRDFATGFTSMQRTVGYTLALGARLILNGALSRRGLVSPLEVPYDLVFPALARHGIRVTREELPWG
ncbi:MAG TPA: saccharopine dehydrogenase C-terminal domain-containing protein [Gemmatimonadaceae bacterium]